jgi:hypothetical protein
MNKINAIVDMKGIKILAIFCGAKFYLGFVETFR